MNETISISELAAVAIWNITIVVTAGYMMAMMAIRKSTSGTTSDH